MSGNKIQLIQYGETITIPYDHKHTFSFSAILPLKAFVAPLLVSLISFPKTFWEEMEFWQL